MPPACRLFSERTVLMEFHEKLQELRRQKGITQQELADALYVSRTAVSKWESGRGYPQIDSLKAIGGFFGITVDELLSGEELLCIAEEDGRAKENRFRDRICGCLDVSAAVYLFLPLFGQRTAGGIRCVSLLSLAGSAPYLRVAYWCVLLASIVWGIGMLALQNCTMPRRRQIRRWVSLGIHVLGTLLFMISMQPYAASLLFVFVLIKGIILLKKP